MKKEISISIRKIGVNHKPYIIGEQFDLMRVCDSSRFPDFFYKDGKGFNISVSRLSHNK